MYEATWCTSRSVSRLFLRRLRYQRPPKIAMRIARTPPKIAMVIARTPAVKPTTSETLLVRVACCETAGNAIKSAAEGVGVSVKERITSLVTVIT